MVLLTMTASIVEAIKTLDEKREATAENSQEQPDDSLASASLTIKAAAIGKPISHSQIIDLWKEGKAQGHTISLESLLEGSKVYVPPPPPKPEPTEEYKALMARLRRDEEERSYERMIQAAPPRESFAQQFPMAPNVDAFAAVNRPAPADLGDDDITAGEVHRQVALIFNFLLSIIGCAGAIWIAAQWWNTTARIFLTMGGSIIVAIAEVSVYSAWTWRMADGERRQGQVKEKKSIMNTWVIGEDEDEAAPTDEKPPILLTGPGDKEVGTGVRKRLTATT